MSAGRRSSFCTPPSVADLIGPVVLSKRGIEDTAVAVCDGSCHSQAVLVRS